MKWIIDDSEFRGNYQGLTGREEMLERVDEIRKAEFGSGGKRIDLSAIVPYQEVWYTEVTLYDNKLYTLSIIEDVGDFDKVHIEFVEFENLDELGDYISNDIYPDEDYILLEISKQV